MVGLCRNLFRELLIRTEPVNGVFWAQQTYPFVCPKMLVFGVALAALVGVVVASSPQPQGQPFLTPISETNYVIGNDIWNTTVGLSFAKKLWYKGHDLVGGAASGHYVSYSELRLPSHAEPTPESL
jgi:hypothetical protein